MSVSFDPNRNPYYQTIPEEPSNETEELASQEEETLANQEKLLGGVFDPSCGRSEYGAYSSGYYSLGSRIHENEQRIQNEHIMQQYTKYLGSHHKPRNSDKSCLKDCCTLL